ncbi:MAG: hypothetical protein ACTJIB_12750 [Pseudoalteromonas prydzensis]|uniref:hypothetical protein n=1 Tax=Pseudoalteromonas prydzensis TaxID=182141 RepID=UPI003F946C75
MKKILGIIILIYSGLGSAGNSELGTLNIPTITQNIQTKDNTLINKIILPNLVSSTNNKAVGNQVVKFTLNSAAEYALLVAGNLVNPGSSITFTSPADSNGTVEFSIRSTSNSATGSADYIITLDNIQSRSCPGSFNAENECIVTEMLHIEGTCGEHREYISIGNGICAKQGLYDSSKPFYATECSEGYSDGAITGYANGLCQDERAFVSNDVQSCDAQGGSIIFDNNKNLCTFKDPYQYSRAGVQFPCVTGEKYGTSCVLYNDTRPETYYCPAGSYYTGNLAWVVVDAPSKPGCYRKVKLF